MAFGALLGTLTANAASITNPFAATGSVAVVVGDLVVAVINEQTNITAGTVSDNLGNTYTAQNVGTDAGTATGKAYYSRVTVAGTLTSVSAVATASTDNVSFSVAVFAGPFATSPLDANPANTTGDTSSPFTCPATGVLAQASELVVAWACESGAITPVLAATSPNLLALNTASGTVNQATIGYQVVAATTSVSPEFTGNAPTQNVLGTMSFKAAAATAAPEGWQAPLTAAPRLAAVAIAVIASAGLAWTPQPITQAAAATPSLAWQAPLSSAPAVAQALNTSYDLPSVLATTPQGWQSPLSGAPRTAKAWPGFADVPLNTAQVSVNFTPFGWTQALSGAPAVAKAQAGFADVPYNTVQLVAGAYTNFYFQPLSVAPPVAKAPPGFGDVPFNTAQLAVNYTTFGWSSPLSGAPSVAKARFSDWSLPYNVVNVVTTAWQSQLSVAPATATAVHDFGSLPSSVPQQLAIAWAAPLSVAPTVAKAQAGFATVPFYPATQVAGIAGMAWFTPLWSVPMRNLVAQQGDSFVPLNTTQQIVVTTPGRRRPTLFIANVGRLMN